MLKAIMKLVILYRPDSEHTRSVEEFVHEFERRVPGRKVEMISLNGREGVAMASLYDVVRYPAILATTDDGRLLQWWQGDQLPLMNEVAAYAQS
jgi:hypothetical protein